MPVRRDGADLLLDVRLTPKAASERIGGTFTGADGRNWLKASVTAPPDKGKANAALVALISRTLRFPHSSILLETGATSRLKRLRLADGPPETERILTEIAKRERTSP